jgi:hypothetical protein
MYRKDVLSLLKNYADSIPESCFLQDLLNPKIRGISKNTCPCGAKNAPVAIFCSECGKKIRGEDDKLTLTSFCWSGDWSGHCIDTLEEKVAPLIHGEVQAIFCWEGGNSYSGLAIKDGKVAKCDVVRIMQLQRVGMTSKIGMTRKIDGKTVKSSIFEDSFIYIEFTDGAKLSVMLDYGWTDTPATGDRLYYYMSPKFEDAPVIETQTSRGVWKTQLTHHSSSCALEMRDSSRDGCTCGFEPPDSWNEEE